MEACILITGFDPFGGEKVNPAWEAVKRLPEIIGGYRVEKLEIPTVFGKAAETVLAEAERVKPRCVLLVGQAGGRDAVTPEKIAINCRSASIPDNAGNQPENEAVLPGGPDGIFTALPVHDIVKTMKTEGYCVKLSYSAGVFVCNDTFYLTAAALQEKGIPVDFIHVPYLPEQAKGSTPAMPPEETVKTLARFAELAVQGL